MDYSPQYLEALNIHKKLRSSDREISILNGISLHVKKGEWVALTGPSGSGKSTLLGILAAIDRPTQGSLFLEGQELTGKPESQLAKIRNQRIGIVFQSFNLMPTLTAVENVETPLYIHPFKKQARQRAMEMLQRVGLADRANHLPHQLSGGEQQRVAIARAIVTSPGLLLADEPTGNLDSTSSRQILTILSQLRNEFGLTTIMVTHDAEIANCADRQIMLRDGVVVNTIANRAQAEPLLQGAHV